MKRSGIIISFLIIIFIIFSFGIAGDDLKGKYKYDDFRTPAYCGQCHNAFTQQWEQAMMSEAYTHHWDEIEYFKLAVPHSEKEESMKGVHDGCNGCHTPLAFMAGDIPPPRPSENSRANESVSCEVCHNITGFKGDTAYNFNYIMDPGETKYNSRLGKVTSPNHTIKTTEIHSKSELCGICHNEKSPFGVWVKSTQLELLEGPYYEEGVVCQDCHMPDAKMKTAKMGKMFEDAKMHLFNGGHDEGKVKGVIEMRIIPDINESVPGETVVFTVSLFNQKTGHKFPTGSVEDRILWLHVEAEDENGKVYHLPVDKKGFEGEEYTIASDAKAYQDMGVPLGIENFEGLQREDVPDGDRIFRMPYFDPQGRMTLMQWNTASLGVDYRIGPRETILETYTFNIPYEVKPGKLTINAKLNYRLLVKPVAEYLEVPEDEYRIIPVNEQTAEITILP